MRTESTDEGCLDWWDGSYANNTSRSVEDNKDGLLSHVRTDSLATSSRVAEDLDEGSTQFAQNSKPKALDYEAQHKCGQRRKASDTEADALMRQKVA